MILFSNRKGFTLVELLMVLSIMGILSLVTISIYRDSFDEVRFDQTVEKLTAIRYAMVGNPELVEGGARKSFGFLGDIGALPAKSVGINALLDPSKGAYFKYALHSKARIGAGWNGPYLQPGINDSDLESDAWGEPILYNPHANPPTLMSLGADRKHGGSGINQDITMAILPEMVTTTVSGFVCLSGGPFDGSAEVEINYPDGTGRLVQSIRRLNASDRGSFIFNNIPLGVRSISVYIPKKTGATLELGPVVIAVDRPNYLVSCNLLDLKP